MNNRINLSQAIDMTTRYRANKESILKTEYQGQNILCISEKFEGSSVQSLIGQEDCVGVRTYFGMDESMKVHVIMVGVNSENEDMLPAESMLEEDPEGIILEEGIRCPPQCPPYSALNP